LASLEQLRYKRHQRPPELGRGEAYLLLGSILTQFRGVTPPSFI